MFTDGSYPQLGAGQTIGPGIKKVKHKYQPRQQKVPQKAKNTAKKWPLRKVFLELCKKTANFFGTSLEFGRFQKWRFSRKSLILKERFGTFGILQRPKNTMDSETIRYNLATF